MKPTYPKYLVDEEVVPGSCSNCSRSMERATKKENDMVVSLDTSQCELDQVLTLTGKIEVASQNVRRDWRRRRRRRSFCPLTSPAAAVIALLIYACVGMVVAVCPNMCSGHGECGLENKCKCEEGWDVVADCSLKACPTGVSWGSKVCQGVTKKSTNWSVNVRSDNIY